MVNAIKVTSGLWCGMYVCSNKLPTRQKQKVNCTSFQTFSELN